MHVGWQKRQWQCRSYPCTLYGVRTDTLRALKSHSNKSIYPHAHNDPTAAHASVLEVAHYYRVHYYDTIVVVPCVTATAGGNSPVEPWDRVLPALSGPVRLDARYMQSRPPRPLAEPHPSAMQG